MVRCGVGSHALTAMILAAAAFVGVASSDGRSPSTDAPSGGPQRSASAGAADPASGAEIVLERPIEVRTRTASGASVRGLVERWCAETFSGSFGTRRWDEFAPLELNRVYRMLMDDRSAAQWVVLGERLLEQQGGERLAETAFQRARRLDRTIEPRIDAARTRAAERRRILAEQRLRDILPEGDDFGAAPWPILTDSEQEAAIAEMKRDAERIMRDAGVALPLYETRYFLLYSELPERETARWGAQLDGMYEMVTQLLHVERGLNLFWGKAVVFIWPSRDRFRVVEAAAFGQRVAEGVIGLCHMAGPKVFVNSVLHPDELQFTAVLLHETTHGIMHRFLTPARLPTWANEGFAERIAHLAMVRANLRSPVDSQRRPQALRYIRQGGDVVRVMRMNYRDGSWPGEEAIGYAVGYLLCAYMLDVVPGVGPSSGRERSRDRFKEWVVAIKGGRPWERALEEAFGLTVEQLAASVQRWHRTND